MAVVCPKCGSDELDLVEKRADETRLVRCSTCSHEWVRGTPRQVHEAGKAITGPSRQRFDYTTSQIQAHPNAAHFVPAREWWSDEDDAYSSIAPTLDNPYCIQPYDPAFFNKGTRGYDRLCYIDDHPAEVDSIPTWMAKPHKRFWYSMCEHHARKWTGWEHRMLPCERHIKVFMGEDIAFEDWTARYGGYVLIQRSASEYMLHLADCGHLGRENDNISITKKPRLWAKTSGPLVEWTREKKGSDPLRCITCL